MQMRSFRICFLCLISVNIILSSLIHVIKGRVYFFWKWNSIPLYIFIPHFLYSFVSRNLDCFHISATMNNGAMNIGVQLSIWDTKLSSSGCIPRSRIVGFYGGSPLLVFWRKLHTVFHNGCTNLYFHQQCTPTSSIIQLFDSDHHTRFEVISHFGFNLYFPDI
jgi:hypothetical protein